MNTKEVKQIKIWKIVLSALFLVLSIMLAYVLVWSQATFGKLPFAQILFHLMVPLEGTESSIVTTYIVGVVAIAAIVFVIIFLLFLPDYRWWKNFREKRKLNKKNNSDTKKESGKIVKISGQIRRFLTRHLLSLSSIVLVIVIIIDIYGFGIHTWIADRFSASTLYEDYYVDSANANITFPADGEKKNLIYILCESLESSFADEANGGCMNENLMPHLTKYAEENIHFSSADNLAGAIEVEGTGWTIAAMVAQMSGVPLSLPIGNNGYGRFAEFMPGITSLGELLEKEGYVNEIVMGSKSDFSGIDTFYTQHGNYEIFDYNSAVEAEYIEEDYYRFWGYEDNKLFEYAKEEIRQLESTGQPFNVMVNTIDLHTTNGYWCTECEKNHSSDDKGKYMDIINCQDRQIYEFVEWCKTQDFYEDTVIIIAGDHLSMAPIVREEMAPEDYERTTFHVIINSDLQADSQKTQHREFTTMDMFPTILASLGCEIEGERLGLGTNLYSDKMTVMEELGKDVFMDEISKNSNLYNEDILGTK